MRLKKFTKLSLALVIATFMFVQVSNAKLYKAKVYDSTGYPINRPSVSMHSYLRIETGDKKKEIRGLEPSGKIEKVFKKQKRHVLMITKLKVGKVKVEGKGYYLLWDTKKKEFQVDGPKIKGARSIPR